MDNFEGKVAVVTGGASGVGRCMCELFAGQGMQVVMADIERTVLENSAAELRDQGLLVTGMLCDVTDPESVNELADKVFSQFGNVHLLCNNAGVGVSESSIRFWDQKPNDWKWAHQVNVMGVAHCVMAFVPRMLANGEEGHVVNTSSGNGGLTSLPTTPIYSSSKAAVTALSEVLNYQFLTDNAKLQAHVLFPGPHLVNTNILNSQRNRPEELRDDERSSAAYVSMQDLAEQAGIAGVELQLTEPEEVAQTCLDGIRAGKFWILPESEDQDAKIQERTQSILTRTNPILAD
jgi:NAD(P)-dependent dehydrogenase (short-subunit alcohol dehydrogenase family)